MLLLLLPDIISMISLSSKLRLAILILFDGLLLLLPLINIGIFNSSFFYSHAGVYT